MIYSRHLIVFLKRQFIINLDSYSSAVILQHLQYFLLFYLHSKLAKQRVSLCVLTPHLRKYSMTTENIHTEHFLKYLQNTRSLSSHLDFVSLPILRSTKKLSSQQDFTSAVQRVASTKLLYSDGQTANMLSETQLKKER